MHVRDLVILENQKRDTPSLNDETWRLKHISKSGEVCQRLSKHGINTVEDLLKEHETNPSSLPEVLWKKTIAIIVIVFFFI